MDERLLFEKFHEALDVDPRPAAYERLRSALIAKTSTPRRRAAFQLRWTRMGFRLAAAIALVAVAVTAGAVFLATHRVAENNVPAGLDANTVAYQKMMSSDDAKLAAAVSNHCGSIDDTGCPAAVTQVNAALEQWIRDLQRFQTPPTYAIVDGQMRLHIDAAIADLNIAVVAFNGRHQDALMAAVNAGGNERGWIDAMVGSMGARHPADKTTYLGLVRSERSALDACAECAQAVGAAPIPCTATDNLTCQSLTVVLEDEIQGFQAGLVRYAAPSSLKASDQRLQSDLAGASASVLNMTKASLSGDQASFDSARQALSRQLAAVDRDCGAILAT